MTQNRWRFIIRITLVRELRVKSVTEFVFPNFSYIELKALKIFFLAEDLDIVTAKRFTTNHEATL